MKMTTVNPNVLKELLEKNPEKEELIKWKFPKYNDWIEGKEYPNIFQLHKLSVMCDIPFSYFFLENSTDNIYPIPHYSSKNDKNFVPSRDLVDTFWYAKKMQEWTRNFLIKHGNSKLAHWGKYKNNYNFEEIVEEAKNILNISENQQKLSLKKLAKSFKKNDIVIMKDKDYGNVRNKSSIVYQFSGLVLYDEVVPVVFVNGNDNTFVKILSSILSLIFVLIGESASFDLRNFKYPTNEIEEFCHKCAKEIIEPIEYFEEGTLFPKIKRNKINFVELDKKTYLEIMNQK